MRRFCIAAVAVGALALGVQPASAASPAVTHRDTGTLDGPYGITCNGFYVVAHADWTTTSMDLGDRSTEHLWFSGTLSNSNESSKSVPYWGDSLFVWEGDTFMATGTYHARIDGRMVQLETGIAAFDGVNWTIHGPQNDTMLCDALA